MEAGLAAAEVLAASSEKILAAYVKAPDCEAVRETVRRETANLVANKGHTSVFLFILTVRVGRFFTFVFLLAASC